MLLKKIMFVILTAVAVTTVAAGPKRTVKETVISTTGFDEMYNSTYVLSPDLRKIAFLIKKDNKIIPVLNTARGKAYDDVRNLVFSPDGKHFAFAAKENNRWKLIEDNVQKAKLDSGMEVMHIRYSPDSKKLLYIAAGAGHAYIAFNNMKTRTYDAINENSISISKDYKLAFSATANDKQFNVIDGKAGPEFDEVGFLLFDATRKNSAYWAKIEKSSYVVLNNKKGEPFESVGTLKFSSDGKHLFYDAVRDGKHIVFSDTSALEQYDKIRDYAISADGKHFAYHISMPPSDEEFSHFVVVDGKKEGPYEEIMSGSMTFSPDGSEISYGGQRPVHEMVNGEEKEVDAYEWFLVRNGKENTRYNMLQGIIVYSADGKHLAYGGEKYTKRLVNLDGNEGAEYDDIYFIEFTPDSKWLIYTVKNNNKEFVVVNDVEGRPYDFLPGQKEFVIDSPTSFHYVAMKGKIIYLVEETID